VIEVADQLRAGIIGTGFIGRGTCARRAGRRSIVSRVTASRPGPGRGGRPAAGRAVLGGHRRGAHRRDDVDVVHICAPNSLHVPLANRALAAGKPVICEKPLAPAWARPASWPPASEAGVVATVVVYRFYPTVREARDGRGGEAGALHLLYGAYLQDWQAGDAGAGWRGDPAEGGEYGAFTDIGVHWCDLMEFCTGQRITGCRPAPPAVEPKTTVQFGHRSGRVRVGAGQPAGAGSEEPPDAAEWTALTPRTASTRRTGHALGRRRHRQPGRAPRRGNDGPWGGTVGRCCRRAIRRATRTASTPSSPTTTPRSAANGPTAATFADGLRAAVLTDAVATSSESSTWVRPAA